LGGGDSVILDNAGRQLTFNIAARAFDGSLLCGPSMKPAEPEGPLKLNFAPGAVCWADIDSEAGYKVEGSRTYVRDCEHLRQLGFAREEIPFSVTVSANATSFVFPRSHDRSLTVPNFTTVSITALDSAGAVIQADA